MAIAGRLLHFMIHVGDIDRSIAFYTGVLGMRVLRRGEFPEEGRRNAFVGYGEEATHSVIELTAWEGKPAWQHGTAFGHLAIGVPDVDAACAALRAGGARIVREPWTVPAGTVRLAFAEDPDGYQIELVQRF